ncbi:MAG: DUF3825 domain-containing protein, partial [Bacteroidia bacterium]|nr:DUF3825 domain-containing protein [Bacteroidia bacterium]
MSNKKLQLMELIRAFNLELGGPAPLSMLVGGMQKVGLEVRDEKHATFQEYIDANHDGIKVTFEPGLGKCFQVEQDIGINPYYENVVKEIVRSSSPSAPRPTAPDGSDIVRHFQRFTAEEKPDAEGFYSCANFGSFLSRNKVPYPKPLSAYLQSQEAFVIKNPGLGEVRIALKSKIAGSEASNGAAISKNSPPSAGAPKTQEAVIKPYIDNPGQMLCREIFWWGQEGETDSLRFWLSEIAKVVKPERWSVNKENDVLEAYLNFTLFKRARRQEIAYARGCEYFGKGRVDYAIVHTGLFDAQMRQVYLTFRTLTQTEIERRTGHAKPWRFECIVVENVNRRDPVEDNVKKWVKTWPADQNLREDADELLREFMSIPPPVAYEINEVHVIGENFARLPKNWVQGAALIAGIPSEERQTSRYLDSPVFVNVFTALLHKAIERGLHRIRLDKDETAFCYNAVFDTVGMLIPISLGEEPDAALAFGKNRSGRFEA